MRKTVRYVSTLMPVPATVTLVLIRATTCPQVDADGDGVLTAAEIKKLAERNRNKFKAQK